MVSDSAQPQPQPQQHDAQYYIASMAMDMEKCKYVLTYICTMQTILFGGNWSVVWDDDSHQSFAVNFAGHTQGFVTHSGLCKVPRHIDAPSIQQQMFIKVVEGCATVPLTPELEALRVV